MEPWVWALALKLPVIAAGAVLYYFVVIKGLRWVYAKLPKSKFVDFLFKERANKRPDYGPGFDATGTDLGRTRSTELARPQQYRSQDHRPPPQSQP